MFIEYKRLSRLCLVRFSNGSFIDHDSQFSMTEECVCFCSTHVQSVKRLSQHRQLCAIEQTSLYEGIAIFFVAIRIVHEIIRFAKYDQKSSVVSEQN